MMSLKSIAVVSSALLSGIGLCADIFVTVDNVPVQFKDVKPIMVNSRVMVPVRGVFEHMNASVDWDPRQRTVFAQFGTNRTVRLPIGSHTATVSGGQVSLDTPAMLYRGRTMVPLRFLAEALGGTVDWKPSMRTVVIFTEAGTQPIIPPGYTMVRIPSGTVLPFRLDRQLSSSESRGSAPFTATLDTGSAVSSELVQSGAILEGHVTIARPKNGSTPGVVGVGFDRIRLRDGQSVNVSGALIGLDPNSVTERDGRLIARSTVETDYLKFVGYGGGNGILVSIPMKGGVLTNATIRSALGSRYQDIKRDPSLSRNVVLERGQRFGVRLVRDLEFRVRTGNQ